MAPHSVASQDHYIGRRVPETLPLPDLLDSWLLSLRAERKSSQTVKSYGDGVRRFLDYCARTGTPAVLDKPTVNAFVADLLDAGAEASTARSRHFAVWRFSTWLAEEGEIAVDHLIVYAADLVAAATLPRRGGRAW